MCLSSSPYWIKIGPYLPKSDRKDLMHAIGSTNGGLIRSEFKGDFCIFKVELDVQKPLRKGLLSRPKAQERCWYPFKYENLLGYYFKCGRMGHILKDCHEFDVSIKDLSDEHYPFSLALKAKLNFVGKLS